MIVTKVLFAFRVPNKKCILIPANCWRVLNYNSIEYEIYTSPKSKNRILTPSPFQNTDTNSQPHWDYYFCKCSYFLFGES